MNTAAPASRTRTAMWLALAAILLAPLVAMRFTSEVNWTGSDFAAAAMLLGALGLAVEAATRLLRRPSARAASVGVALLAVAAVWAEGAVGIFH